MLEGRQRPVLPCVLVSQRAQRHGEDKVGRTSVPRIKVGHIEPSERCMSSCECLPLTAGLTMQEVSLRILASPSENVFDLFVVDTYSLPKGRRLGFVIPSVVIEHDG